MTWITVQFCQKVGRSDFFFCFFRSSTGIKKLQIQYKNIFSIGVNIQCFCVDEKPFFLVIFFFFRSAFVRSGGGYKKPAEFLNLLPFGSHDGRRIRNQSH